MTVNMPALDANDYEMHQGCQVGFNCFSKSGVPCLWMRDTLKVPAWLIFTLGCKR
jgi:hypothetical protein